MNVKFKEINTSKGKQRMLNIHTLASNVFMENDSNLQEYSNNNYIKSLSMDGFNLVIKNFNDKVLDSIELPVKEYLFLDGNPIKLNTSNNTISHSTSGATAGEYGDKNAKTLNFGDCFKVLYSSVDEYGHVTYMNSHDITLPSLPTASATQLGVIKIGDNLSISEDGLLSVDFSNVPTENTTYSLTGEGNKVILKGSDKTETSYTLSIPTITVDTELSDTSENPLQNKAIYNSLLSKVDTTRKVNGKTLDQDITLTAGDLGIDMSDASSIILQQANKYTDDAIDALIGGASGTADTLKELQDLISDNKSLIDTLNDAIGLKANNQDLSDHINDKVKHITSSERESWTNAADAISKIDITKYLPLTGGTITGDMNFTGANNIFKRDSLSKLSVVENTTGNQVLLQVTSSDGGYVRLYRGDVQWTSAINAVGGLKIYNNVIEGPKSITLTSSADESTVTATKFNGIATSSNKINTDAGSGTRPVYFKNGIPVECDNTIGSTLPSLPETDSDNRVPVSSTDGIAWRRPKVKLKRVILSCTLNTGQKSNIFPEESITNPDGTTTVQHKYSSSYDVMDVYLNGIKLNSNEYTYDETTQTITLTNAMTSDGNYLELYITYTETDFYNTDEVS